MKSFFNTALLITNIISLIITVLFGLFFGIVDDIMGPGAVEKLLEITGIQLNYDQVVLIFVVCEIIMFATYILRRKLYK